MTVPNNQNALCPGGRLHDAIAVLHRQGQRLLHQHMLAAFKCLDGLIRMEAMGRRDINRFDIGISA